MRKIDVVQRGTKWLVSGAIANQLLTNEVLYPFLIEKKKQGFNVKFARAPL